MSDIDGWIPVRERLPDLGKAVLVWSNDYGVLRTQHRGHDGWDGARPGEISYWMPMPPPPNSELG